MIEKPIGLLRRRNIPIANTIAKTIRLIIIKITHFDFDLLELLFFDFDVLELLGGGEETTSGLVPLTPQEGNT